MTARAVMPAAAITATMPTHQAMAWVSPITVTAAAITGITGRHTMIGIGTAMAAVIISGSGTAPVMAGKEAAVATDRLGRNCLMRQGGLTVGRLPGEAERQ